MNCPLCRKDGLRPHTHFDGKRRWVTTWCAKCGWVDTTSWSEKRPAPERQAGEDTGSELNTPVPIRVLVVDDDATIRDVCAELIRDLGYEVNVVADAAEALAHLRNERFDAVVTDIVLPGMDGWQLIAAAIDEQPMLRFVTMTGADEGTDRERALALGVPFLQKPFTRVELRDALHGVLTSSRRP